MHFHGVGQGFDPEERAGVDFVLEQPKCAVQRLLERKGLQRSQSARIEDGFRRVDDAVDNLCLQSVLEKYLLERAVARDDPARDL